MSPRWSIENRWTVEFIGKLLDAHLFTAMDFDAAKGDSRIGCSCGKKLSCERAQFPERIYRKHLAEVIVDAHREAASKG